MRTFIRLFGATASAAALAATPSSRVPLHGTLPALDGTLVDLSTFTGKVVLVVNTASKCGFTRQYKGLQALHEKYAARGLAVLGFPCNQFGRQEPGTAAEIKAFCEKNYGVTFQMFSKVDVNGTNAPALFQYLTSADVPIKDRGPVRWNFEKFLIGRDGRLIARFRSLTGPESKTVVRAIEAALAEGEQPKQAR